MSSRGIEKINKIKMVQLSESLIVPPSINSKLRIPNTYAEGDAEYIDDEGNKVDINQATHIKLNAKDERSDLTVGPAEKGGMFKLMVYLNDENHAVTKKEAKHTKEVILDENYRAIRY